MPKKIPVKPEGLPAENPLERIQAGRAKLLEISTGIRNVVRDVDAANLALLDGDALEKLEQDSKLVPIEAGERIEKVLEQLGELEQQAKDAAKDAREAGKVAEHLGYAVRSLYRGPLARAEAERARLREREASRQAQMFPAVEVGQN